MNAKSAALRTEVLALPTEERAVVAVELLASLAVFHQHRRPDYWTTRQH